MSFSGHVLLDSIWNGVLDRNFAWCLSSPVMLLQEAEICLMPKNVGELVSCN